MDKKMEPKNGYISQMFRNKKGVTTLYIKTKEISQEEFDNIGKNVVVPIVKVEIVK